VYRRLIFVVVTLITITFTLIPSNSANAGFGKSTTFFVFPNQPWTSTRLELTAGSVVTITASGFINIVGPNDPGKPPDGEPSCIAPDGFLAPGLPCWSLLGRVGNGDIFFIGSNLIFTVQNDGSLFLGVNDNVFIDNFGGWTATVTVQTPPPCSIGSIQIDASSSNGVVSGSVSGSTPCEAVIEIHNNRIFWVNMEVTPIGGVTMVPAGNEDNLFATALVLGPDDRVRYLTTFTQPGQSIVALLDVTTTTGETAQFMNLTQAIVDTASTLGLIPGIGFRLSIQGHQDVINTFGAMPHLTAAARALFTLSPNSLGIFNRGLSAAARAGELETLGAFLERQGLAGTQDAFTLLGGDLGRALSLRNIIWRNFRNAQSLLVGEPAGFIVFVAQ